MSERSEDDRLELRKSFRDHVNMSPKELSSWLDTEESKAVGQKSSEGAESTGHRSGRRILDIKDKQVDDYTSSDYDHMNKVVNYIKRHTAQRPSGDVEETDWRYSLMNWGHDPTK